MNTYNRREAVFTLASGLTLSAPALAQPFQEGIEYLTLDQPLTTEAGPGKIEVIEFFWYKIGRAHV